MKTAFFAAFAASTALLGASAAEVNTQLRWIGVSNAEPTPQVELKLQERQWNATATLQAASSYVNELAWNIDAQDWQFSMGKKIVSWDVGYAFRPNDMVQQEDRRSLFTTTLEGRNVLMAEHFGADSAWSVVASNSNESALNLRYYQRSGAVDWFAFARSGERTGASLGTAGAWVVSDAVELHGSIRTHTLTQRNQLLMGGTWTNAAQVSVLVEAWRDETAAISVLRDNRLVRLSWDSGAWRAALDAHYLPTIQSKTTTASLTWKGERTQVQTGLRTGDNTPRQAFVVVTFSP